MHLAMIIASLLCILIGIFPGIYYQFLPYPIHYEPYTYQHTIGVISLFSCVALVFFAVRSYIAPKPKINLDTDWFYITLGKQIYRGLHRFLEPLEYKYVGEFYKPLVDRFLVAIRNLLCAFNDGLLFSLNRSLPESIYIFSQKKARIFDGNLIKYIQIFVLAIIFFYLLGLISF